MDSLDEKIIILWNKMAEKYGLTKVQMIAPARKKRLLACIKEVPSLADWIKIIQEVPKNDFNLGYNDIKWKANIDWLLNTKCNYAKLLEDSLERGEPVIKENAKVASRFNTGVGYEKLKNGVSSENVTRSIGEILKGILWVGVETLFRFLIDAKKTLRTLKNIKN